MKRIAVWLCLMALAGGVFWQFPLFTIERSAEKETGRDPAALNAAAFDAATFAESFWNEKLLPSLRANPDIPDAATLSEAFRENPQAAGQKFGRKVGISRMRLLVLRGSGVVTAVNEKGIAVALEPEASTPDLVLHAGPVFGNVVRDASGLLDPGEFSNSQQLNDISAQLNRIVEQRVIPRMKELSVPGQTIQFVGCAEVPDDGRDMPPLKVIPLDISLN
jgi:predicted lipoprotein